MKKIISRPINIVQSVVYDKNFNMFTCLRLGKKDFFKVSTSIYEKARLRRFTALIKQNVDNSILNSVAHKIRTNKND